MTEVTRDETLALRPLRVLLVEDSADDAALVVRALRSAGYVPECRRVEDAGTMRAGLAEGPWDVVLSDHGMPIFDSVRALAVLHESGLDLPFIVVSSTIGEEAAVGVMRAGAHDYVLKANLTRLGPAIARELREAEVRRERRNAALALEEDARVFRALALVGRELIACSDTAGLLHRLGQLTIEVLGCDSSFTLLRQPESDTFVPVAVVGGSAAQAEELRALELPGDAVSRLLGELDKHETVQVLTQAPQTPWAALPRRFGITVLLYSALRRRGNEIIGVHAAALIGREEPFTPAQESIARKSAQLASMALQTVGLVEELDRANRLKSDFAATMSHELRTPLNVFMGYNDMLLAGDLGPVTPEQADALRTMEKSSRQLLDLISALLDLSRLDRERETMQIQAAYLPQLLSDLERETRDRAKQPGVQIVWDVPGDLPPLQTDAAKLTVILRNLLSNALKFTSAGSVTLRARGRDGGIEISVADTGIGIGPEVLPIMFDLFRQGDSSSTRRFGGVGVGLYIAQRLIGRLHGTIAVESTPGGGATFRVWLASLESEDASGQI